MYKIIHRMLASLSMAVYARPNLDGAIDERVCMRGEGKGIGTATSIRDAVL